MAGIGIQGVPGNVRFVLHLKPEHLSKRKKMEAEGERERRLGMEEEDEEIGSG